MKSTKRKGVSQRMHTGKTQNCGSFSVLLSLVMSLVLSFHNTFSIFAEKKKKIQFSYDERLENNKIVRGGGLKKGGRKILQFLATVSNLLCKIS